MYNSGGIFEYGKVIIDGEKVEGAVLTSMAFADAIPWFPFVLTIAIILFAISTMISWSYYGLQSWMYLFGKSKISDLIYKIIFLLYSNWISSKHGCCVGIFRCYDISSYLSKYDRFIFPFS